jgi:hypothetical protein
MDINLGNKFSSRLTLYENDKLEIVAREFAELHNLD